MCTPLHALLGIFRRRYPKSPMKSPAIRWKIRMYRNISKCSETYLYRLQIHMCMIYNYSYNMLIWVTEPSYVWKLAHEVPGKCEIIITYAIMHILCTQIHKEYIHYRTCLQYNIYKHISHPLTLPSHVCKLAHEVTRKYTFNKFTEREIKLYPQKCHALYTTLCSYQWEYYAIVYHTIYQTAWSPIFLLANNVGDKGVLSNATETSRPLSASLHAIPSATPPLHPTTYSG